MPYVTELIWLQSLFKEHGVFLPQTPTLWCDNTSTTYVPHGEPSLPCMPELSTSQWISTLYVTVELPNLYPFIFFVYQRQGGWHFYQPLPSYRFQLLRSNLNIQPLLLRMRGPIEDYKLNLFCEEDTNVAKDFEQSNSKQPKSDKDKN